MEMRRHQASASSKCLHESLRRGGHHVLDFRIDREDAEVRREPDPPAFKRLVERRDEIALASVEAHRVERVKSRHGLQRMGGILYRAAY